MFRKLEVKDLATLQQLIAENVEGIEPGMKIVDSRLLLGQAAIDLVGLDARDSLVLIAIDFTADEGLLLRVMDAYSWCLEYPETVRRLYPSAKLDETRPPRVVFVVERLSEAFLRRVKQLRVPELACYEFRHLEANGASAMYFDPVETRRPGRPAPPDAGPGTLPRSASPAAVVSPVAPVEPPVIRTAAPLAPSAAPAAPIATPPAPQAVVVAAPVVPSAPAAPPVVAPKPSPAPEPPAVTTPVAPVAPPPAPAAPAPTPVAPLPQVVAEAAPAQVSKPAGLSADLATLIGQVLGNGTHGLRNDDVPLRLESAGQAAHRAEAAAPEVDWNAFFAGVKEGETPEPAAPVVEAAPAVDAAPMIDPAPEAPAAPEVQAAPDPGPPSVAENSPGPVRPTPPVWAKPAEPAAPADRTYFFAQATKSPDGSGTPTGAAAPTPPAAPAPAPGPESPAPAHPDLDALSFPKDGLSRQWLEFLNQLGANK